MLVKQKKLKIMLFSYTSTNHGNWLGNITASLCLYGIYEASTGHLNYIVCFVTPILRPNETFSRFMVTLVQLKTMNKYDTFVFSIHSTVYLFSTDSMKVL